MAKQLAQVFKQGFSFGGLRAHQRDGAVERIEQKVRANARLQFGQPGGSGGWGFAFGAKHQGDHQHGGEARP